MLGKHGTEFHDQEKQTRGKSMNGFNILAVDSGKYLTKAVSVGKDGSFVRSSVSTRMKRSIQPKSPFPELKTVGLNGLYTIVGQGSINSTTTSKMEDLHRRCVYSQIPQHFPNGSRIILGVGCPLSDFRSLEKRNAYKKFMLNLPEDSDVDVDKEEVEISFELEGDLYHYVVEKIAIFPEGSGMLLKHEDYFKDKTVAITDIGGLNVNVSVYRSLVPDINSFYTIEKGGNKFRSLVQQELNANIRGCNITSVDEMDEVLRRGYVEVSGNPSSKEESMQLIRLLKEEFFDDIVRHLWDLGVSVNTTEFIFVGGGSLLFREQILSREDMKKHISNDPQWENAEGFAFGVANAYGLDIPMSDDSIQHV